MKQQDTINRLNKLKESIEVTDKKKIPGITNKKISFVDHYIANGFNGTAAAISAGYSKKNAKIRASTLLAEPLVQDYLNEQTAKIQKKFDITYEWIVDQYLEIIESAQENGNDGEGTIKDRKSWLTAVKELSAMCGLDKPKQIDITSNGNTINIQYVIPTEDINEEEEEDEED